MPTVQIIMSCTASEHQQLDAVMAVTYLEEIQTDPDPCVFLCQFFFLPAYLNCDIKVLSAHILKKKIQK